MFWCPYSPTTVELFYDTRCAISGPRLEPLCWQISKVEDMNVKGIIRLTFKQDRWNSHTDMIEYNDEGDYVGAWCNYYKDGVPIADEEYGTIPSPTIHSIITYSGIKPEMKVGGSSKKFIVKFYDDEENENVIQPLPGHWEFIYDDKDANDLFKYKDITEKCPNDNDPCVRIETTFIGNDEWINRNIEVWYITDNGIKSHITINIVGL